MRYIGLGENGGWELATWCLCDVFCSNVYCLVHKVLFQSSALVVSPACIVSSVCPPNKDPFAAKVCYNNYP